MAELDRRTLLKTGFFGAACALLPAGAWGQEVESHGLSTFGDLKYGPDFKKFGYVRADAPKGGAFSQLSTRPAIISPSTLSTACTSTFSRARARWGWTPPSPR